MDGIIVKCEICKERFSKFYIKTHQYKEHNVGKKPQPRYQCQQCFRTFVTKSYYDQHMKREQSTLRYKCNFEDCSNTYSHPTTLRHHVKSIHMNLNDYCCEICNYCSADSANLEYHIRNVHKDAERFICDEPGCKACYLTSEKLEQHAMAHKGEAGFQCTHCVQMFKSEFQMRMHRNTEHYKLFMHTCLVCSYSFLVSCKKRKKKTKRYTETGLKIFWKHGKGCEYMCQDCTEEMEDMKSEEDSASVDAQQFSLVEVPIEVQLREAAKKKNKEFVFHQCNLCKKKYKSKIRYEIHHKKAHKKKKNDWYYLRQGEKKLRGVQSSKVLSTKSPSPTSFKCNLCGFVFVTEKHLIYHHRKKHKGKRRDSSVLLHEEKSQNDPTSAEVPTESNAASVIYQCNLCGYTYKKEKWMRSHHKVMHKGKPEDFTELHQEAPIDTTC